MDTKEELHSDDWLPEGTPTDRANPARIYDYLLGGYHNFESDRKIVRWIEQIYPEVRKSAIANRTFNRRAVKYMADEGIHQWIDLGSGIPTVGHVHEVVQKLDPANRVVYVDIDPIAVAHGKTILKNTPNVAVIQGDIRQPEEILNHPETRRHIDFQEPVGVLMVAVLHFVQKEEQALHAVHALRDATVRGSFLAIAHGTYDDAPRELVEQFNQIASTTSNPYTNRTRAQIQQFFEGYELVEPGLVYLPLWRPESPNDLFYDNPERSINLVGVGRKL